MAKKKTSVAAEKGPAVVRVGLCGMQVCVPKRWTNAAVAEFANRSAPTGIRSRWQVCKRGSSMLDGHPVRVPCEERKGFVHVVLEC